MLCIFLGIQSVGFYITPFSVDVPTLTKFFTFRMVWAGTLCTPYSHRIMIRLLSISWIPGQKTPDIPRRSVSSCFGPLNQVFRLGWSSQKNPVFRRAFSEAYLLLRLALEKTFRLPDPMKWMDVNRFRAGQCLGGEVRATSTRYQDLGRPCIESLAPLVKLLVHMRKLIFQSTKYKTKPWKLASSAYSPNDSALAQWISRWKHPIFEPPDPSRSIKFEEPKHQCLHASPKRNLLSQRVLPGLHRDGAE